MPCTLQMSGKLTICRHTEHGCVWHRWLYCSWHMQLLTASAHTLSHAGREATSKMACSRSKPSPAHGEKGICKLAECP